MKKFATAFSQKSVPHRCVSVALQNTLQDENTSLEVVNVYGRLFDYYARYKPDAILMSILDYSQEVHDFITEHQTDCKIFLLFDKDLGPENDELWNYLTNSQVKLIVNTKVVKRQVPPIYLTYDNKYDNTCFANLSQERNGKIALMSDGKTETIEKSITPVLYPNTKHKINVFNDTSIHSHQNLGMLDPRSLNIVLNEYSYFIDLTDDLTLEAQACGIKNLDLSDGIEKAIESGKATPEVPLLDKRTFEYFTKHEVVPYIRKNI